MAECTCHGWVLLCRKLSLYFHKNVSSTILVTNPGQTSGTNLSKRPDADVSPHPLSIVVYASRKVAGFRSRLRHSWQGPFSSRYFVSACAKHVLPKTCRYFVSHAAVTSFDFDLIRESSDWIIGARIPSYFCSPSSLTIVRRV